MLVVVLVADVLAARVQRESLPHIGGEACTSTVNPGDRVSSLAAETRRWSQTLRMPYSTQKRPEGDRNRIA